MVKKVDEPRGRIKTKLIQYIQQYPGAVVTIDELCKAFPEYDREKIMQAMWRNVALRYLPGLSKRGNGIWEYSPNAATEEPHLEKHDTQLMMVEVLKSTDEYFIVIDQETTDVYRMVRLG